MAYGMAILPDDNGKVMDISTSSRVLSYLGRYRIRGGRPNGDNVAISYPITNKVTGGVAVAIPNSACFIASTASASFVNLLRGVTVSGTTLTANIHQESQIAEGSSASSADISLFEIPNANTNLEAYGIAMYDSVNFLALTDVSQFGYVTYRATINVAGTWTIPDSVPNRDTCVVFARFNSTGTPLWHDRDTNQLRTYTGFGSNNGSSIGGSINNIQIVIVSVGFSPGLPNSGYGVVIRNASGVITYSSKYPPLIWRGGYFGFPYYLENDSGNPAKIQWIGSSGNVSQPMVPLGSYGFQCGDFRSQGTYPQRVALYSGLLMSGNSVSTYRAKPAGNSIYDQFSPVRGQMGYNLPCIDAADYF